MAEIVGIVAAGLQLGTLALKILSVTSALPGRVSSTDRIKTWTSEYLLLVVELKRLQCRMGESDPRVRHCQHEAKRLHSLLQLFCASPGAPRRAQLKNFALVLSEGSNLEKCISRLRDTLTL
ncbi:hypothetical protein T440DRAFT_274788 [Plenodomus tracheiphilus IPT5]|uniref:Uncharacterized protein n=1 Tax=Plenodomus tracheiphilus IPT5 TaxID=1408161 RepID=A0A6A7BJ22_9PLEO|nr:hypothetical protein T440DRAFT_274788 [Plenodomus tracheiphilus IPT5]